MRYANGFLCRISHHCEIYRFFMRIGILACLIFLNSFGIVETIKSSQTDKFKKIRTVGFSDPLNILRDELLIAEIKSLDVDISGRFLAVDLIGEQAFLFDSDGSLLSNLDPSSCYPGFEFRPVNAIFLDDQSIFLVNAGPWGYRFTAEGKCIGNVHDDYIMLQVGFMDTDTQGNLVGLYRMPAESIIKYMTSFGETTQEIILPQSTFPNANIRIAMGGIVADKTHIYYASAVEPYILKISIDGTIEAKISRRTSWFQEISKDIPVFDPSNPVAFMDAIGDFYGINTLTTRIFQVNDHDLMVQYAGPKGLGYQLFTKGGNFVAEEFGIDYHFDQAKRGFLYRVVQPEIDNTGLPNPIVEVYQYLRQ